MDEEKARVGLGKIVYSAGDASRPEPPSEEDVDETQVQEASEESFPASDAPGYVGGSGVESD